MSHINLSTSALQCVRDLAHFCGLLHDIGKLTAHFQAKLKAGLVLRDAISHEWISAWLLAHMLQAKNVSWNGILAAWGDWENSADGLQAMARSTHQWQPFSALNDFASASLMVVATHHRLFSMDDRRSADKQLTRPDPGVVSPAPNHVASSLGLTQELKTWHRPEKCFSPADKKHWQALLQRAGTILNQVVNQPTNAMQVGHWHKTGLLARAAMVLADQHVSARSFQSEPDANTYGRAFAYANAVKNFKQKPRMNQPLSWHLAQVGSTAAQYVDFFIEQSLPALPLLRRKELHGTSGAPNQRFAWQAKACEFVESIRRSTAGPHAFLVFNVASTGSGKTRANVRILESCRSTVDPLRITAGFNLKTLTLQTAAVYRKELQLQSDECACIIGDPLARALHLYEELDDDAVRPDTQFDSTGCDSAEFFAALPSWLQKIDDKKQGQASLIGAPVLVCTMDYLVAAGDPSKQAHHAYALLRIAHSDLLIDEADSYDPKGLVAVLRVVQMASMFGRNVVVSSATLSPVLAEQIHQAWSSGIAMYKTEPDTTLHAHELIISNLGATEGMQQVCPAGDVFEPWYSRTLAAIYATPLPHYRLAQIVPILKQSMLADTVIATCLQAHDQQSWTASVGDRSIQVSIGLIRIANVVPLQDLAQEIVSHPWRSDTAIKLCAYHAKDVTMRRYFKEQALDMVLKRHGNPDLSQSPFIQPLLSKLPPGIHHLILLVAASPIEEVGRDHDFDWAIIEPSSTHAIIQLAGRVNRHRLQVMTQANVFVLDSNIRRLNGQALCFIKPGLQQADSVNKPLTHQASSATELLQPVSKEAVFPLDASLIFSATRRCLFAAEDDNAVRHLLKNVAPYFDVENEQWACDWLYVHYPLREERVDETWIAESGAQGKLVLKRYEKTIRGFCWIEKGSIQEQRLNDESTVWLCPDVRETEAWIMERLEAMHLTQGHTTDTYLNRARQFSVKTSNAVLPQLWWSGIQSSH